MNNTDKEIINEYENYLIRVKIDTNNIYDSIKKLDDVKKYESIVKLELEKLENLSEEYKLYDSNYESLMIKMGKFAVGLRKIENLNVDSDINKKLIEKFINYNSAFEELQRRNIMKDAYVWK